MTVGRKRALRIVGCFLVLGAAATAWLGYMLLSHESSWNRASAIRCTLEWARLAPFPQSAGKLTITTSGSAFTRSFHVSFTAPAEDIERWLQQSPGTRQAVPTTETPGVREFEIRPGGGGAIGGTVSIDDGEHRVSIDVSWS